jgi:uncharacterized membrane protein
MEGFAMSNKGIIDTIFDIYVFKKVFPWIIVIAIIIMVSAFIKVDNIQEQYDSSTTIFNTEFNSQIEEIATKNLNSDELTLNVDTLGSSDIELEYTMVNKNLSIEQYDQIIKDEITKVYNEIKGKKMINDGVFASEREMKKKTINFYFTLNGSYSTKISSKVLEYNIDNGWDESYQELMNESCVGQEDFDNAMAAYQKSEGK